jgi:hypothetical protein
VNPLSQLSTSSPFRPPHDHRLLLPLTTPIHSLPSQEHVAVSQSRSSKTAWCTTSPDTRHSSTSKCCDGISSPRIPNSPLREHFRDDLNDEKEDREEGGCDYNESDESENAYDVICKQSTHYS